MAKNIFQKAVFKRTTPERLYKVYLSSRKHAQAIGSNHVKINPKVGGSFRAFNMLNGKFLALKKNELIVQTWRSKKWKKSERDSTLILSFKKVKGGARIDLVHMGVPNHDYQDILKGWPKYYWRPWRKYLKSKK